MWHSLFYCRCGNGGGTLNLQDIKALGIWPPLHLPRRSGQSTFPTGRRLRRRPILAVLLPLHPICRNKVLFLGKNKQIIKLSLFFHFRGSLICFSLRKSKPGQEHDALAEDWGQNPRGLKRDKAAREKGFTNSILPTPRGVFPAFPPASFLPHKSHSPCHNPCHTPPDLHLPA